MRASYAVTWQHADDSSRSGRLDLLPSGLAFEGSGVNGSAAEIVPYAELARVRIARSSSERLSGRPTLVLDSRAGDRIRIAGVAQPGMISELAERLAALRLGERSAMSRVLVVVPLKAGAVNQAADLLRRGPPFDPGEAGLERHHVFLTEQEAVFLFEARTRDAAERLVADLSLWSAASGWADVVAGPARLADDVYSWVRPQLPDDVVFAPTPGPGDSDGGDIY